MSHLEKYFLCIKKTTLTVVPSLFAAFISYYAIVVGSKETVQNLVIAVVVMVIAIFLAFIYERTKLLPS